MDSTTQFVSIVIILLALVTNLILTQSIKRRRQALALRPIPAYETVPLMVGEAIEADRPVHVSFGHTGLGGTNTVLTLAAAEMFYQVTQRAAIGATPPIMTMSDPSAIPLAQTILHRAYHSRERIERFRASSVRWYPSPSQSLAFAAALTATMGDDRVSGNVLTGSFGSELALILDAANRRGQPSIAMSDRLQGQAVAWALSDTPLIGEELFMAGGYLGEQASLSAAVVAQDRLRWLFILFLIVVTANALSDGALFRTLSGLLGGR